MQFFPTSNPLPPTYKAFFKQMRSSSNIEIQNIISNLVICYTNNLFVSPKKYESLTESEEEKINQIT